MVKKLNPYYDATKLGLDLICFDEGNMSYEYNTLCFWSVKSNPELIYTAEDSGCSCPTPFEQYDGIDQKDVLSQLERVGSIKQAEQIFDDWNERCSDKCLSSEKLELVQWLESKGLQG